jgi:hypothetical protein
MVSMAKMICKLAFTSLNVFKTNINLFNGILTELDAYIMYTSLRWRNKRMHESICYHKIASLHNVELSTTNVDMYH